MLKKNFQEILDKVNRNFFEDISENLSQIEATLLNLNVTNDVEKMCEEFITQIFQIEEIALDYKLHLERGIKSTFSKHIPLVAKQLEKYIEYDEQLYRAIKKYILIQKNREINQVNELIQNFADLQTIYPTFIEIKRKRSALLISIGHFEEALTILQEFIQEKKRFDTLSIMQQYAIYWNYMVCLKMTKRFTELKEVVHSLPTEMKSQQDVMNEFQKYF
jgi:tetratricopeptide (TPR) repeat protein